MLKRSAIISDPPGSAKWQQGLPVASLLLAATLWGISWYPIRLLENSGLHGLWVSLLIYLGTLLVSLPVIIRHWRVFISHKWPLFILALATGWLNISFILAVLEGQVVRVLLLFYLSPVWATLLAWLVLKEKMQLKAWVMVVMAISGALIMLWPPAQGMPLPQTRADWYAISSSFCFAFANMMIRKIDAVPVTVKTVSGWLGVVLVASILIMMTMTPPGVISMVNSSMAMLYGFVGITIMTLAVVYGVSHMPLHRSSVMMLFEIVVGSVSAVWLANETIMPREWLGGGLVILAAYLSARLQLTDREK